MKPAVARITGWRLGTIARNMVLVGGGSAVGQVVILCAAPVLARLYTPDAFGLLAVYTAALVIAVTVVSLRFDAAIPIAADDDEALHLLLVSVAVAFGLTGVMALAVVVSGGAIANALGAGDLGPFLFLLLIAVLAVSIATALSSWAVYQRLFPALARVRAFQAAAQVVSQAGFGLAGGGAVGLIAGDVIGRVVGMERLFRSLFAALRSTRISAATMRRYARERWGFARVMTAASVLNTLTQQTPFLLIPAAFGLGASGQFFLAYRMLVLPAGLVSAAVNQVFFGEASSRRGDPERLRTLALDATVALLVFTIPTYLIVAVGGGAIVQAVFGPAWAPAGLYAQILAPSLIVHAAAGPISSLLLVGRREQESLAFTAAELVAQGGALIVGIAVNSLVVGVVLLSVVSLALAIASLWRFLRVASVHLADLVRPSTRIAASTLPGAAAVAWVAAVVPAWIIPAAAVAWLLSLALAARSSPEMRALLSGAHD